MAKKYIEYDSSRGHPVGRDLYYECVLCNGLISSWRPPDTERCPCGNLHKEVGRLGTSMGDTGMRLVRVTDASPGRRAMLHRGAS